MYRGRAWWAWRRHACPCCCLVAGRLAVKLGGIRPHAHGGWLCRKLLQHSRRGDVAGVCGGWVHCCWCFGGGRHRACCCCGCGRHGGLSCLVGVLRRREEAGAKGGQRFVHSPRLAGWRRSLPVVPFARPWKCESAATLLVQWHLGAARVLWPARRVPHVHIPETSSRATKRNKCQCDCAGVTMLAPPRPSLQSQHLLCGHTAWLAR